MKVDRVTTLLDPVRYLPSPNCDERPKDTVINLLVIHSISLPPGQFGTGDVAHFFCNQLDFSRDPYYATLVDLKVSSHLFIDRLGAITQFVPFEKRAWHAGKSSFQGRENCNDFSIGIELEGTDTQCYEKAQYKQLARVINTLREYYPEILRRRIVGHADIAPGRKTDPGTSFEWSYLDCLLMP
jgi:AmpD protein